MDFLGFSWRVVWISFWARKVQWIFSKTQWIFLKLEWIFQDFLRFVGAPPYSSWAPPLDLEWRPMDFPEFFLLEADLEDASVDLFTMVWIFSDLGRFLLFGGRAGLHVIM